MNKNYRMVIENIALVKDGSEFQFDGIEKELEKFFLVLTEEELKILKLRYGLEDEKFKTIDEVAEELNLKKERVRNIETLIFRKLRFLHGLNGNSFIFNPNMVAKHARIFLEIQEYRDRYYARSIVPEESNTTKYYKKVIEIAESLKKNKKKTLN